MKASFLLHPLVVEALRLALALLFLVAATHKLRALAAFRAQLSAYRLLPGLFERPVALAIALLELLTATGLLLPRFQTWAALLAVALLLVYTLAIAVNLLRGRRDLDCGCAGPRSAQGLSSGLLIRNLGLLLAAWYAARPVPAPQLGLVDSLLLAALVSSGILLYATANTLLANAWRETALGLRRG